MVADEPFEDDDDWYFRRYEVTFRALLGELSTYRVFTRCGEHKAVAIALREHLLGRHDYFHDFPLNVRVNALPGTEEQSGDLGDHHEG